MKCLFLNYLKYDFTNTQTGQLVQGVNCYIITPFNVNNNTVGCEVSKYSLTFSDFQKFGISEFKMPCVVDIDIFTSNTLKGKPVVKVIGFKFVKEIDLLGLIDKK